MSSSERTLMEQGYFLSTSDNHRVNQMIITEYIYIYIQNWRHNLLHSNPWWCLYMETFSSLLTVCDGNQPMAGGSDASSYVLCNHEDVIKWKHFPRYCPLVRGIHRSWWIPRTKASFDVFLFNLRLNKQLSKQSRGWWFETPSSSLLRHWMMLRTFQYL